MPPGGSTGVHAHTGDEHHVVLAGRWQMRQGEHVIELGPGDYLAWDPSVPHDVENIGDELGRILVQQAPDRLADGGTAVVLANWLHVRGEDWRERVAQWVAPTGCDAWVVQREVQDPAEYAGLWLRDAGGTEGSAYDARYGEWLDELASMHAEGIGFGWVVLHRGGTYGAGGPRIEDVASAPRLPRGDEVADLAAARAAWRDRDARWLLSSTPRRATGLRLLRQERVVEAGVLSSVPGMMGLVDGWRPDSLLDLLADELVRSFDGATTVLEAVERAASAWDLDPDDVLAVTLVTVRDWVECGWVGLDSPGKVLLT